jgi:hypothetical protein
MHPVQKTEINGRGNSLSWPRNTIYPQKLALTSPTSGGRSVGIVRLRTKATELSLVFHHYANILQSLVIFCAIEPNTVLSLSSKQP